MKMRLTDHLDIADCGDVPMVKVDNKVALRQLEQAGRELVMRSAKTTYDGESMAKDGQFHTRILTLVRHTLRYTVFTDLNTSL